MGVILLKYFEHCAHVQRNLASAAGKTAAGLPVRYPQERKLTRGSPSVGKSIPLPNNKDD